MALSLASLIVKLEADTTNFRTGIGTAGKVLGGLAAIVGTVGGIALKAAANIESQRIALKNLTGSAEEANRVFQEIQDFAAKTPFETDEILKATTAIIGFGVGSKQALTDVKNLAAAAASSSEADLNKIAVNFGQISAAGKATARDLREFVNQGINIYGVLADSIGVSIAQVQEMQSQGKITGAVLSKAFADATGPAGRFRDTLIDQSKSLKGLYSTLKSQVNIALGNLGTTLLPAAKEAVKGFIDIMNGLIPKLNEVFGDDFAVKFAAGVRAAFQSAGTETEILYNKMKGFFLLIGQAFAELSASLANSTIGGVIFSDEDIRNSNLNLLEVKTKILDVIDTVDKLQASGNTFSDRYKIAFADISAAIKETSGAADDFKSKIEEAGVAADKKLRDISGTVSDLTTRMLKMGRFFDRLGENTSVAPQIAPGTVTGPAPQIQGVSPEFTTNQLEQFKQLEEAALGFANTFGSAFQNAIVVSGTFGEVFKNIGKNLKGVFKSLIADLVKMIVKLLAIKAILALFPGLGAAAEVAGGVGGGTFASGLGQGLGQGLFGGLGLLFGSANKGGRLDVNVGGRLSGSDILLSGNRTAYLNSRGG